MIFDKELCIESEIFESLRLEINNKLRMLLRRMTEKGVSEGKVTAQIGIELNRNIAGLREVLSPEFKYKVGFQLTLKEDETFDEAFVNDELVHSGGTFVLRPIIGDDQQSIYDYMVPSEEEDEVDE